MTHLIECIKQMQTMSGEEAEEVTEKTVPLGGLCNFDSMRGVVTTVFLEKKLNWTIPSKGKTANIFVSEDGTRALTIAEIAENLANIKE